MKIFTKNLKEVHWTIKGSTVAVFVVVFAFINFILSINWGTSSFNHKWLLLMMAAIVFFVICSVIYSLRS